MLTTCRLFYGTALMKVGKKTITIHDPVFEQKIIVLLNNTAEDFKNFEKKHGVVNGGEDLDPNFMGFTTHLSSDEEPNIYIIFIPKFDWTIQDQQTLIHEIIHVTFRIWGANNIVFIPETQEFLAHQVDKTYGMIARKLITKVKKKNAKK